MKRILCLLAALLFALPGCAADPAATEPSESLAPDAASALVKGDAGAVWLFMANVGKGDALVLRVGDWLGLIDTGKTQARGRVIAALKLMGVEGEDAPDALFLTHTDDDHAGGLRWMAAEALAAGTLYASAMYTVKPSKHPAADLGAVQWLKRGDAVPLGTAGAVLSVLAPASLHDDEDDNSLVMLLEMAQGRMLFTGDMESAEEAELLSFGDDLKCDVLKVPNHGDGDATGAALARACAAGLALISTDSYEKPGTPDPDVISRLQAAGSRVLVTEDGELGILVRLKGGEVTAWRVDFGAAPVEGPCIAALDASDDTITLGNRSDAAIDLSGCYLYSDKGEELFAIPDGTSIGPGETLTVGTKSTKGPCDLIWPDKKVINRKKTDTVYLYDSVGRAIDRMGNGK